MGIYCYLNELNEKGININQRSSDTKHFQGLVHNLLADASGTLPSQSTVLYTILNSLSANKQIDYKSKNILSFCFF